MTEPMVPIDRVAEHFSVKVETVRLWVKNGKIPKGTYARIGKTMRFKLEEVERFFTHGTLPDLPDEVSGGNVPETEDENAPHQYVLDFGDNDDQGEDL